VVLIGFNGDGDRGRVLYHAEWPLIELLVEY
jgi:hypothetical protein